MNHMNIKQVTEAIHKRMPAVLAVAAYVGMSIQVRSLSMSNIIRANQLKAKYIITGNRLYLLEYLQMTMSNNWLKMYGYPMARRARR